MSLVFNIFQHLSMGLLISIMQQAMDIICCTEEEKPNHDPNQRYNIDNLGDEFGSLEGEADSIVLVIEHDKVFFEYWFAKDDKSIFQGLLYVEHITVAAFLLKHQVIQTEHNVDTLKCEIELP